jgi:hypothetical protein
MSERIIDPAVYPNEARVQALRLRDQRDQLREALREAKEAIDKAMWALYGEASAPPDVTTAQMWLRTTFPPDHPNYVPRDHEFFRRHPR